MTAESLNNYLASLNNLRKKVIENFANDFLTFDSTQSSISRTESSMRCQSIDSSLKTPILRNTPLSSNSAVVSLEDDFRLNDSIKLSDQKVLYKKIFALKY